MNMRFTVMVGILISNTLLWAHDLLIQVTTQDKKIDYLYDRFFNQLELIFNTHNLSPFDDYIVKKSAHAITLYYVREYQQVYEQQLYDYITKYSNDYIAGKARKVLFTDQYHFWGPGNDELVLQMNDCNESLIMERNALKVMLRELDLTIMGNGGKGLYDVEKSEAFPFTPHMGIIRLRSNAIMRAWGENHKAVERFEQLKCEVGNSLQQLLHELDMIDQPIIFDAVSLLQLPSRTRTTYNRRVSRVGNIRSRKLGSGVQL